jgi:aromatase
MAGHTENSVVIDAPREFVFDLTNNLHLWEEMFTEYETVEVLEEKPDYFRFRLTLRPDEDGRRISWISERRLFRDQWRIEAHRLEPLRPFSRMDIEWSYEAAAESTEMRWQQDFTVVAEAPFTEADAIAHINGNSREQMAHIKAFVEKRWAEQRAAR